MWYSSHIAGGEKHPVDEGVYNPWPHFRFTGKLRPFPQTAKRAVPEAIARPDYADHPAGRSLSEESLRGTTIKILDDDEIEAMRVAGRLGRECLDEGAKAIEVGITTDELDRLVHEAAIERDCYPSPLNYYNFPKSCCTSVNEVICHGIPDKRPLENGDICNIDVTVYHHGFHGDLNETFFVGDVSEKHKKLVRITYESLCKAIELVRPGVKYREIGNVIQKYVAPHGFSVVRSYCGHGIHRVFHTAPNVPHYASKSIGIDNLLKILMFWTAHREFCRWSDGRWALLYNRTNDFRGCPKGGILAWWLDRRNSWWPLLSPVRTNSAGN